MIIFYLVLTVALILCVVQWYFANEEVKRCQREIERLEAE